MNSILRQSKNIVWVLAGQKDQNKNNTGTGRYIKNEFAKMFVQLPFLALARKLRMELTRIRAYKLT
jgi:hypothetical protein